MTAIRSTDTSQASIPARLFKVWINCHYITFSYSIDKFSPANADGSPIH